MTQIITEQKLGQKLSPEKLQTVRGTKDLYGQEIALFNRIVGVARNAAVCYGFNELATPIFEFSEIYERNLGETSDIISKEVYKFPDRGNNFLTLRPEFTAGIVRAFIANGDLQQVLPQKFFSSGPLFRYDRPQKGRQRQFHQINFEVIGAEHFLSDVELLMLSKDILEQLGIFDKTILQINSLGCEISKNNYQNSLIEYFTKYQNDLSEDSKIRLEKNPLRILDSKDIKDIELIKNAPQISDFYEADAKKRFENILQSLDNLDIKYQVNSRLVRGLDYYTSTVFEFVTNDLGAQNTVLAGGRYDKLISKMGGNETPAIGFAAGIERLMLLQNQSVNLVRPIVLIYVSDAEQQYVLGLANQLRKSAIQVEVLFGANMKKQMKRAGQVNAKLVIIVGDQEIKNQQLTVKNFDEGSETKIVVDSIVSYLKAHDLS